MQLRLPCMLMRGGTSKGPFFLASDLPADPALRDEVLLAVMGSPDLRQIDGLGGATSLTSKVAMVGPSADPGADVDYLFAQVLIDRDRVDTQLAGVGPFAILRGLIEAEDPVTRVRILNRNTGTLVEAVVQTPGGQVSFEGETQIAGVPGRAAPIALLMTGAVGSKTGALLPTGAPAEIIEGIEVSCVDVCVPMVIAEAAAFGKTGHESAAELDRDRDFFARLEGVRQAASLKMGLGEARGRVLPKFCIVAGPRSGGTIASRYFVPTATHEAYAVTGGGCLAAACMIEQSIAHRHAQLDHPGGGRIVIEHPAGSQQMDLDCPGPAARPTIEGVGVVRTARLIFDGQALIPAALWEKAVTPGARG